MGGKPRDLWSHEMWEEGGLRVEIEACRTEEEISLGLTLEAPHHVDFQFVVIVT